VLTDTSFPHGCDANPWAVGPLAGGAVQVGTFPHLSVGYRGWDSGLCRGLTPRTTMTKTTSWRSSAPQPCVPVSRHTAPQWEGSCHEHPRGLVICVCSRLRMRIPSCSPIPDDCSPVQSVLGVIDTEHLLPTVPTAAYPLAFPAALASWGIPPPCRIRLTPAHR
jgi:hypothetical protein